MWVNSYSLFPLIFLEFVGRELCFIKVIHYSHNIIYEIAVLFTYFLKYLFKKFVSFPSCSSFEIIILCSAKFSSHCFPTLLYSAFLYLRPCFLPGTFHSTHIVWTLILLVRAYLSYYVLKMNSHTSAYLAYVSNY